MNPAQLAARAFGVAAWAYLVWILLTWTATAEQLIFGGCLAVVVGVACAFFGPVVPPWRALDPRRLAALLWLAVDGLRRIVAANISLARRVWAPGRPVPSGMVIVPTRARSDAALAWTGLITSVIVDNQIVDLQRDRHLLQYHAVAAGTGTPRERADRINAPIEEHLARIIAGGMVKRRP